MMYLKQRYLRLPIQYHPSVLIVTIIRSYYDMLALFADNGSNLSLNKPESRCYWSGT